MRCQSLSLLAISVVSVVASADFQDSLHVEFRMGALLPRAAGAVSNLQAFSGALGGVKASAITSSGDTTRPFEVDGDTFTDFESAANRACDNQHNSCANVANSKQSGGLQVSQCDTQDTQCKAAASAAPVQAFANTASSTTSSQLVKVSSNAEFDFFCEQ